MGMDQMRKTLKIALIAFISLNICSLAIAFDSSTSFSGLKIGDFGNGVSSRIDAGLISTSFNDLFSNIMSSATATEFRLLEAEKPVDKAEIEKYIEERYGALPKHEREKLKETLIQAKEADENLKSKMASPSLSDKIKLNYAQERERLRKNVWKYEMELIDNYAKLFKPQKYTQVQIDLISLNKIQAGAMDEYNVCIMNNGCVNNFYFKSIEEGADFQDYADYLDTLERGMTSLVVDLIQSPAETTNVNDRTMQFMKETLQTQLDFRKYIEKLYLPQGNEP